MARKQFTFEKLEVWQSARRLALDVYQKTKDFPKTELFEMTNQLKRSSVSVASNLAEGSSRASLKDQAHFSTQAYSSLMETASHIIISTDLGFLTSEVADDLLNHAHDLAVRISNFRESQVRRSKST
jgi:four helix bundle protein